jgi:predicted nucleotidyltransferase component of viral defense system
LIQRAYITAWRSHTPWLLDSQVEQDLLLSRALIELYSEKEVARHLAFRGGTALHKLCLPRSQRYSEDIDLVQVQAGPIGPVMTAIHKRLDPWLGKPQWKQGAGRATLYYRFTSEIEPVAVMRLKIEINTREHFSVLDLVQHRFEVNNGWFIGSAKITTYELDELLGTKLRALYQRKKGRDLFDLWTAAHNAAVNPKRLVECFERYVEHDGLHISRAEFEANLYEKINGSSFGRDVEPLIASDVEWNQFAAAEYIFTAIAPLLSGDPWKGGK